MSRHIPHVHGKDCAPGCVREWDLDESTQTAAYRIVAQDGYGKRHKHDKPRWWPFAFHAYKALIQLLGLVALYWVSKLLHLPVNAP
jgi:hypothetical protein